jgi:hypothetical protein
LRNAGDKLLSGNRNVSSPEQACRHSDAQRDDPSATVGHLFSARLRGRQHVVTESDETNNCTHRGRRFR